MQHRSPLLLLFVPVCRAYAFLPPTEPPVVVDLRPRADFEKRHLAGSVSLPAAALYERMYELPPPQEWPLTLVGSRDDLARAREILAPRGWRYEAHDANGKKLWDEHATASGAPAIAQAWRPNAFLAAVVRGLDLHALPEGSLVDVGCGSGRDAVFLAQALKEAGVERPVIGVDNHGAALERTLALACSCGVSVRCVETNLRKSAAREAIFGDRFDASPSDDTDTGTKVALLHGCRFLHRPLLESAPDLIAPGGLIIYSHFMDPLDGPPLAPPFRPSRRLQRGELRRLFEESMDGTFEVLRDETGCVRGVDLCHLPFPCPATTCLAI